MAIRDAFGKAFNTVKSRIQIEEETPEQEQMYFDDEEYDDEGEGYYEEEGYVNEDEEEEEEEPVEEAPKAKKTFKERKQSESKKSRFSDFDDVPEYDRSGRSSFSARKTSNSGGARIYNMNTGRPQPETNVNLFVLEDIDDARNVADCMKKGNFICIVDFAKISPVDERRILDFIDGVKYILKFKITKIAERLYLVVPSTTKLSGPFEDDFDINNF